MSLESLDKVSLPITLYNTWSRFLVTEHNEAITYSDSLGLINFHIAGQESRIFKSFSTMEISKRVNLPRPCVLSQFLWNPIEYLGEKCDFWMVEQLLLGVDPTQSYE